MYINYILSLFVIIPFITFFISLLIREDREKIISQVAFYGVLIHFIGVCVFIVWWLLSGMQIINVEEVTLYASRSYAFVIDFYFDKVTAAFVFTGSFISVLIIRFSRFYMHMEVGYKRFFNTVLFFFSAYNLTSLSGNFETLFIGWEMIGICSFLLIAFYRHRYLPVKNAVKVFSIYRIGDVGILLAMWASHHLWDENITFKKLNDLSLVHSQLEGHSFVGLFIAFSLLTAAAVKSAQLPFSSWLPRAMEGPTPSSAIFYGSLSVHFGVFLLLRTHIFWGDQLIARVAAGVLGGMTALIAIPIARVQSTIKTQIAYASLAQIGIMFIEIALGWDTIALLHFMGNAFLRTYQLLISPSVVAYKIRDMFYHFTPKANTVEIGLPLKLQYTMYVLAIREFYLDTLINKLVFKPFRSIGHRFDFITEKNVLFISGILLLIGLYGRINETKLSPFLLHFIPAAYSFIGFVFVLKSFSERKDPILSIILIWINHIFIALGISFNEHFGLDHIFIYLSGLSVSGIVALYILNRLKDREPKYFNLKTYYGHVYEYPRWAFFLLMAVLGLMGFPITPSFLGEDLIFSHIHEDQYLLAFFFASSYIISGISLIRIYARIFLGNHIKKYHPTPLKYA